MWHHEANRRMHEGKLEETEDCFRRAIYINGHDASHLAGLACSLLMLVGRKPGAMQESLALFERTSAGRPAWIAEPVMI